MNNPPKKAVPSPLGIPHSHLILGSAVLIKPHANEKRMFRRRKAVPSPPSLSHSHLIFCGLSQTALPSKQTTSASTLTERRYNSSHFQLSSLFVFGFHPRGKSRRFLAEPTTQLQTAMRRCLIHLSTVRSSSVRIRWGGTPLAGQTASPLALADVSASTIERAIPTISRRPLHGVHHQVQYFKSHEWASTPDLRTIR